jgi:hypothetical protein
MEADQLISKNQSINSEEDELFGKNDLSVNDDGHDDGHDDGFPTLANIECSLDGHNIIFKKQHPANSLWTDVEGPNLYSVSATINGAREDSWNQAIQKSTLYEAM